MALCLMPLVSAAAAASTAVCGALAPTCPQGPLPLPCPEVQEQPAAMPSGLAQPPGV
ncbi:MAG: hypothetical protein VKJ87_07050 [Synechococcus sp.]|nr:hypothetical protein [Synechococcus sp.]